MKKNSGFTLIELLVAIVIFAIISLISYRIISSLITTKNIVVQTQNKWNSVAKTIFTMNNVLVRIIPLSVLDSSGNPIASLIGKSYLNTNYDSQLEVTQSGFIGDEIYGSNPPQRIGFRFINNTLYLLQWPVLNRIITTRPNINILLNNIKVFTIEYMYPDKQWRDIWPLNTQDLTTLPKAIRVKIKLQTGEDITRQWLI